MAKNRDVTGAPIHCRTRTSPAPERVTKEAVNHSARGTRRMAVRRCPHQWETPLSVSPPCPLLAPASLMAGLR